jgi:hypothetical protein
MIPNDLAHRVMASSAAKSSSSTPPRGRAPRRRPDSFDAVKAVVLGHGARAARRRGTYEAPVEVLPDVAPAVHPTTTTTTTTTRDEVKKRKATTEPEAASGHAKKRAVVPAHDDASATVSPAVRKSPRGHAAPRHEPPPRNLEESLLVADEPTLSSTSTPRGHARERDEQRARLEHAMGTSPFARMGVTPPAKLPVDAKTAAEVLLATVCGEELPLAASAEAKALARFAMAGAEVGIRATKIPAVAGRRAKELTRANAKLKYLMDEETT